MSIDSEFFGGQPPKWVSGTTYPLDFIVRSPASQHHYVRTVAGAGTTDPSADGANWSLLGAAGRRSIQQGEISIASSTATGTATISAVVVGKHRLTLLGVYTSTTGASDAAEYFAVLELTNSTTITARRVGAGGSIFVRYQIEEFW